MSLFAEFKKFVCEAPEYEEIDHSSWECCAIGEFANFKEADHRDIMRVFEEVEPYIAEALNLGHAPGEIEDGHLATYGGLCLFIREREGSTLEEWNADSKMYDDY